MLRTVFDKTGQTKWRPDQTIIKYDYFGIPVIDGEEMIKDPASRTRSIQYQFLKKHKIKWSFNEKIKEWWYNLDNVLYTYLEMSDGDNYNKLMAEWYELFDTPWVDSRIIENISKIYAWCMAIDTSKKDLYLSVLKDVFDFQVLDAAENSNFKQAIDVTSRLLEQSGYNSVFTNTKEKQLVISWSSIEDYVNRNRINMSLDLKTYKEHFSVQWYNIWFVEDVLNERMIYWIVIPFDRIPKEFLIHPEFYRANKHYINNK